MYQRNEENYGKQEKQEPSSVYDINKESKMTLIRKEKIDIIKETVGRVKRTEITCVHIEKKKI